MKLHHTLITASLTALLAAPANAQTPYDPQAQHTAFLDAVTAGCPERYTDITVAIGDNPEDLASPPTTAAELWADGANGVDKTQFETQYNAANPPEGGLPPHLEIDYILDSVDAIQFECNAHRLVLLKFLVTTNQGDAADSAENAGAVFEGINFAGGRWLPGDIRMTGRSVEAQNWLLLHGQSIGSDSSTATLKGDKYRALFEVVKTWPQPLDALGNPGPLPNWDTVGATLPDMRGKTLYAAGGGLPQIGSNVGSASVPLTSANMPQHNHAMTAKTHAHGTGAGGVHNHNSQTTGNHGHTMGNDTHSHTLRTSIYGGSGAGQTTYPYFQGMARINYQNTIPQASAVLNDTHSHSLTAAGNHKHTIYNSASHGHTVTGNGNHAHENTASGYTTPTQVSTMSPGIVFNVEIKL